MEQDDGLAESKSRAYQLIGRNVLLFQEMEQLLKIILPRATVSISSESDVKAVRAGRYAAVENGTLGNLVNRLIDEVCVPGSLDPAGDSDSADDSDQIQFAATFRLKLGVDDATIQRLKDLVEARNYLVHHLLSQVDARSAASWRSIHDDLENQQQQVLAAIKMLQALIEAMEMARALVAHPEVRRELLYGPIREQLVEQFIAVAQESADPDGWTSLKAAINSERFVSPEVISELRESYQVPTVSAFLEAVGGFELRHVTDQTGRSRCFYRITGTDHPGTADS